MNYFLMIDTSTQNCSVAIGDEEKVLYQQIQSEGFNHAVLLPSFVQQCLSFVKIKMKDLTAISVSIGPGSYTGLRVGLSFSKALCVALNKPLITISTLEMMTCGMLQITKNENAVYVPLLDARRLEVYTAIFNNEMEIVEEPYAAIVQAGSWNEILNASKVIFGGPGAVKTRKIIQHQHAVFLEEEICEAKNLHRQTIRKFHQNQFADLAYSEPFYLKEFNERI